MRHLLDVSQRRGELETAGAAPFHLIASFEYLALDGKTFRKGSLDELWEDARHYRKTITLDGQTLIEVDNGRQAWRTGTWNMPRSAGEIHEILTPFSTHPTVRDAGIIYASQWKGDDRLECIRAEPDLPGVSPDLRIAKTSYCMEKGNHLLRVLSFPNGITVGLNDVEPFGKKYIARSMEVASGERVLLRLHVDSLLAASDFSSLETPPPPDAQLLKFHRADVPHRSSELMPGRVLYSVEPKGFKPGLERSVVVTLHVDTSGNVASAEINSSSNVLSRDAVLAAVKQWKFEAGYQDDKLAPFDIHLTVRIH
jgi:TonB family protein